VEAEIRRTGSNHGGFGLSMRGIMHVQTLAWVEAGEISIREIGRFPRTFVTRRFEPGEDWHTYRLESQGRHVRLLVDGQCITEATVHGVRTNAGYYAGLLAETDIAVRSYRVLAP
jgi:hypothetical protein